MKNDISKDQITLKDIWSDSYDPIYEIVDEDKEIASVFKYNIFDRLAGSVYLRLIMKENDIVGFVNLVYEKKNNAFLFLDMGIKEKYRNQGIGSQVLQQITSMNISTPIILETKQNNTLANGGAIKTAIKVMEYEDRNIYLLQKDRLTELMDNNLLEKLAAHYQKPNNKRELIKR